MIVDTVGGFVGTNGFGLIEQYGVARRTLFCPLLLVNDNYSFSFQKNKLCNLSIILRAARWILNISLAFVRALYSASNVL